MAVGTQERQVLDAVVAPVAVDVVQLEGQRAPPPLADPALLARRVLEAVREQPALQVVAVAPGALREEAVRSFGARPRPTAWLQLAPENPYRSWHSRIEWPAS
jgi:hypothetical protein